MSSRISILAPSREFIDAEFAPLISAEELSITIAIRLASYLPGNVSKAQQTVTTGTADLDTAAVLDIALNASVCQVDRSDFNKANILALFSKGIYRGDLVRNDMRLK